MTSKGIKQRKAKRVAVIVTELLGTQHRCFLAGILGKAANLANPRINE